MGVTIDGSIVLARHLIDDRIERTARMEKKPTQNDLRFTDFSLRQHRFSLGESKIGPGMTGSII